MNRINLLLEKIILTYKMINYKFKKETILKRNTKALIRKRLPKLMLKSLLSM